jgi:hypothetical protein
LDNYSEIETKVRNWLNHTSFDFQTIAPDGQVLSEAGAQLAENAFVKLVTTVLVNLCAAWVSIKELWQYVSKSQSLKEILAYVRPSPAGSAAG